MMVEEGNINQPIPLPLIFIIAFYIKKTYKKLYTANTLNIDSFMSYSCAASLSLNKI